MLEQAVADVVRIGFGLVHLVDRHDHRDAGSLGVIDGLDRLRHDAVIGGHHQHDDVGDVGAALAHLREGSVARRVEEGDEIAALGLHLVAANVLGDAAGFALHHIRAAQGVEQAGLAVVDMAHDGDDRQRGLSVSSGSVIGASTWISTSASETFSIRCGRIPRRAVRPCPASIVWLTVTIIALMEEFSRDRRPSRPSAWPVRQQGDRLGHHDVARPASHAACSPPPCMRRSAFSRARLSAARLRARRPSSSLSAFLTVSLPTRRLSDLPPAAGFVVLLLALGLLGSGARPAVKPRLRRRGASSTLADVSAASRPPWRSRFRPRRPRRGLLRVFGSLLRSQSLRLGLAASARSLASSAACLDRLLRACALLRPAAAVFLRLRAEGAPSRACGRFPAGAALLLGPVPASRPSGAGAGAGAGAGRRRRGWRGAGGVSPGFTSLRRRFTSTATLLVRPWLKVCLTSPGCAPLRLSGLRAGFLSSSLILAHFSSSIVQFVAARAEARPIRGGHPCPR